MREKKCLRDASLQWPLMSLKLIELQLLFLAGQNQSMRDIESLDVVSASGQFGPGFHPQPGRTKKKSQIDK